MESEVRRQLDDKWQPILAARERREAAERLLREEEEKELVSLRAKIKRIETYTRLENEKTEKASLASAKESEADDKGKEELSLSSLPPNFPPRQTSSELNLNSFEFAGPRDQAPIPATLLGVFPASAPQSAEIAAMAGQVCT